MTNEERDRLRLKCGGMLRNNNLTIKTKKGKETVWAFWIGVIAAQNEKQGDAYVTICLMSARFEDLVTMPEKETT